MVLELEPLIRSCTEPFQRVTAVTLGFYCGNHFKRLLKERTVPLANRSWVLVVTRIVIYSNLTQGLDVERKGSISSNHCAGFCMVHYRSSIERL